VLEQNPENVKIVYKNFPLNMHRFSAAAALAATAAQKQGKFWQYHDLIFENFRDLSIEKFTDFAKQLNLNLPQFKKDMDADETKQQVGRDFQEGRKLKVTGTPTIFINGRLLRKRSLESIQKIIDEELK
jgi:protein-disulfide isomerase